MWLGVGVGVSLYRFLSSMKEKGMSHDPSETTKGLEITSSGSPYTREVLG